jgi:replication factor C small subunit
MAAEFYKRCKEILKMENVKFDNQVLAEVIKKYFPDNRRILNELQRYGTGGQIDVGILSSVGDVSISDLVKSLRDKEFTNMRKWVATNIHNDVSTIFRKIYDSASDFLQPQSIPQLVTIIADYQYKSAFVVDQEINLVACLTEIMVECDFK